MPNTRLPGENDNNTLYITLYPWEDGHTFRDIIEAVQNHFGEDSDIKDFNIKHLHFRARNIGYDLYDPTDYDDYFVIHRNFSI